MHNATNRLIHETSPYLLQHARNPVDWYPWGPEALQRARTENKPILVSIGYAACHWCHVMERESFENEQVADYMNLHFINIKIDREERPDLDHIYMDAVQAMTGSGGWPLNCFLTPEGKPFYGGTYFPPRRAFNRPSWLELLESIQQAFETRRHEIDAQAENLTAHLVQSNQIGQADRSDVGHPDLAELPGICEALLRTADREWGGFGQAPKFPQTQVIRFLLHHYSCTGNEAAVKQALLSLDCMMAGGIYDQVGGGFARYSTDTEWFLPHFEKMLYDNALLLGVLSEAFQLTGQERYQRVIRQTLEFVRREMTDTSGGFYSALDADSEGEEGRYYVWSRAEVDQILGGDAGMFCSYYDITEAGNWEGKNILRVRQTEGAFCRENQVSPEELGMLLDRSREKLLEARKGRARPLLDDKVLLGWNALMNTAFSRAYMATGDPAYRDQAVANMQFLMDRFRQENGNRFFHTWKQGVGKFAAFLDDYAFLIQALLHLQAVTGELGYLRTARQLAGWVLEEFAEEDSVLLCYTPRGQEDVIVRKKEVYDGAMPSGNAVMAQNLLHLSILCGESSWRERALSMCGSLAGLIRRYPGSFGAWACLYQELAAGTREIAVVGPAFTAILPGLLALYLPHSVVIGAEMEDLNFPLLAGKKGGDRTMIYLCHDYSCQQPVDTIERFISLINRSEMQN